MDRLFLRIQRAADADGFEDVVKPGQGEVRVKLLLPLPVSVELLAQVANALFQVAFFEGGEGEGFEAAAGLIPWPVFKGTARS